MGFNRVSHAVCVLIAVVLLLNGVNVCGTSELRVNNRHSELLNSDATPNLRGLYSNFVEAGEKVDMSMMTKRMMEVMAVRKRMAKSRKVTKHNNKMRKRRTKVTPIGKRAARATTRNH